MNASVWHPGTLLELSGVYWQTCTLHASVKLGVFTCIGDRTLASEAVAEGIGADLRATTTLLNALTAMGLLKKSGTEFANTDAGRSFLVEGAPGYIGHMILHHHNLMESWARLDQAAYAPRP